MLDSDIVMRFREGLSCDLKPSIPGPVVLGGPHTQHLSTHFKFGEERWDSKAVDRLAQLVNDFPNAIEFYRLDDPLRQCTWEIFSDDEVAIRRYDLPMKELWTEPAEGEIIEGFVPRKKWDAHTKRVYEVVFRFEQ